MRHGVLEPELGRLIEATRRGGRSVEAIGSDTPITAVGAGIPAARSENFDAALAGAYDSYRQHRIRASVWIYQTRSL